MAVLAVGIVILWIVVAVFAESIAPRTASAIDSKSPRAAPSAQHLLGTDLIGRDVLSRVKSYKGPLVN